MAIFFELSIAMLLFYLITALWILEFIIFPPKASGGEVNEQQSFKIILGLVIFNIALTIGLTSGEWFILENQAHQIMRYIGLGVYILGFTLRYIAAITLGKHFTRDINVDESMRLVSHGVYKILRHPLYLGLFLLVSGVPLFFANYFALIIAIFSMFGVLNRRMKLEEAAMERLLQDNYRNWKRTRYRFIPFIY